MLTHNCVDYNYLISYQNCYFLQSLFTCVLAGNMNVCFIREYKSASASSASSNLFNTENRWLLYCCKWLWRAPDKCTGTVSDPHISIDFLNIKKYNRLSKTKHYKV